MLRFILRRLLQAIPIILATTFVAYGIIRAAPGDPVQMLVGDPKKIPPSVIEGIKRQLGLDKPWYVSYVYWLRNLIYNPPGAPIVDVVLTDSEAMAAIKRSAVNLRIDRDTLVLLDGQPISQHKAAWTVIEKQYRAPGGRVLTAEQAAKTPNARLEKVPRTQGPLRERFNEDRNALYEVVFLWTEDKLVSGVFDDQSSNDNEVSRLYPRINIEVVSTSPEDGTITYLNLDEGTGEPVTLPVDTVNLQIRLNKRRVPLRELAPGSRLMLVTREEEKSKLFALADAGSAGGIPSLDTLTWQGQPLSALPGAVYTGTASLRAVFGQPAKRFDLGESFTTRRPVTELYLEALNNTFFLVLLVLILEFLIAVPVGIIVALWKNSVLDYILTFLTFVGISLPNFWLALVLLMFFTFHLNVLPAGGMQSRDMVFSWGDWNSIVDRLKHLIMPLTVLTLGSLASVMRYTRAAVLDILHQDYVRTAKAKGLPYNKVVVRHILRNALIPIITLLGLSLPFLIGGSFIVETIFTWPGMGRLGLRAVFERDYPVIMAGILFGSMMIILGQLVADVLYAWANPRIRKSFEA